MIIFDLESHKFADIFPMIEGEAFEDFKEDIKNQGLKQTIVLFEGKILDGRNRYKACKELKIEPKFEEYKGDTPLQYVISLNLKRRDLSSEQRAVIAQEVMPQLTEEIENVRRKKIGLYRSGEKVQLIAPSKKQERKTIVIAGKQFKTNAEYIRNIKKLKEAGRDKEIEEIKKGTKKLVDIKKEDRLEKIKKQREELDKTALEKPKGLFDVIVIDPPWRYDGDGEAFEPEGNRGTTPYVTMSLEEIKNIKLPVKENCVLWLWTTNLFLPYSYNLLKEWGFELKSMVTWDKQHIGTGRWLRSQTEHCLLATKGKPFFNNTKWSTLISEKRTEHSTKPEIFYKMVDEICAGRKLDYFARKKREGWDVYGNEVK
jgi:N6-adenosine-specific RNA methylase IME4/ParB-like chromosome segregation protein Spo0J